MTSVLIAIVVYPILAAFENKPWYGKQFVQKTPGEIKRSLLLLFLMFAALITVAWGLFDQPQLAATSILMWGTGDAAAALIGIPCGKHKVHSRLTDGKKSWEGSLAMFAVSLLSGIIMLLFTQDMGFLRLLLIASFASVLGTATELFSSSEYDTVTVPIVIVAVLLIMAR